MEKTFRWILAFGSVLFVLSLLIYMLPNFAFILLLFLVLAILVVLLFVALTVGWSKWRKSSKFWPMPALVCLAFLLGSFYAASPVARYLSDGMFKRHLGDYTRVVEN